MRVSSDSDRQTTNLQKDALLLAGVDNKYLFEDRISGATDNRPGLKKALKRMKKGDCLVVWKLDRLGRSLPHLLKIITGLKDKGISFKSLTEQMDTTTPHGEFLFNIFGSLAQYERGLTRERVLAGLEAAARRGNFPGRPRALNETQLADVKARLANGESKPSIQRSLNLRPSTFYHIINNYI